MTDPDLEVALDRVVEAARAHLAAVRAAGGRSDDEAVWRSYVALNNASFGYDELLLDTFGEVTPWDLEPIDPTEADRQWAPVPDAESDQQVTISVRQRRDFTVPSVAALLRAAETIRRVAPRGDGSAEPIETVGAAVAELMQAGDGALGSLDVPELEPLRGVVTVSQLPPGAVESDDEDEDDPFVADAAELPLFRFDEYVEDSPESR
jgi:hypothetical protein